MRNELLSLFFFSFILSLTTQYEYLERQLFIDDTIPPQEYNQIQKIEKQAGYNQKTYKCEDTSVTEFRNKDIIGQFDLTNIYKLEINNIIIPHWKIQLRLDILLLATVDLNEGVEFISYQKSNPSNIYFKENHFKTSSSDGINFCSARNQNDILIRFSKEIITTEDIVLLFNTILNQSWSDEGVGIKNLQIYVDTCHASCKTCKGPEFNDCLSCQQVVPNQGICNKCSSGLYQHGICQPNCNLGFQSDSLNKICIQKDENCEIWNQQSMKCDKCNNQSYIIDGNCVKKMNKYEPISVKENSQLIFKGLLSDNFGEIQVKKLGLITTNFFGNYYFNKDSGSQVTSCDQYRLLGGAYLSYSSASVSKKIEQIDPHWQIEVNFILFKIDSWVNKKVEIKMIDGVQTNFEENVLVKQNLCGNKYVEDQVVQISSTFEHNSKQLDLEITTNLDQKADVHSFGIRELYIIITECKSICTECKRQGCTKCQPNLYLYNFDCLSECPQGTYTSGMECKDCKVGCLECTQENTCKSCKDNYFLDSKTNSCTTSCPPTYYGDNKLCKQCDSRCLDCIGPGSTNCKSCKQNYLLNNTCVPECIIGTYKNDNNHTCSPCHESCKSCTGPLETNCSSCQNGKYYQESQKKCLETCLSNYYGDKLENKCLECHPQCQTCTGKLDSECSSCKNNTFLKKSTCVDKCDDNQFGDISQKMCIGCNPSCKSCSGPSTTNCNSCNDGNFLDSLKQCNKCNTQCKTCSGQSDNCTSCSSESKTFLNKSGQCVQSCNENQFGDEIQRKCLECDSNCKSCSGPSETNCNSCKDGNFLDESSKQCKKCNPQCQTCSGKSDSCTSCSSESKTFLNKSGQCVQSCNENQFGDEIQRKCLECDSNCKSCSGPSATNCNSCNDGNFLDNLNQCNKCNTQCKTCSGQSDSQCTSCSSESKTFLNKSGSCVQSCNENQFGDEIQRKCLECDSNCKSCSGPSATNCNSCKDGNFLDESSKQCKKCNPQCQTCSGQSNSQCTSCSSESKTFLNKSGSCVDKCDSDQFGDPNQNKCLSCNPSCKSCRGSNENDCTSCKEGTFLNKQTNQCVPQCPNGYFNNDKLYECSQCDKNCLTCTGASEDQCLSCQLPLYYNKLSKRCVSECNSDQYKGFQLIQNQQSQNPNNNDTNSEQKQSPICIACNSNFGKGCTSCTDQSCSKCDSTQFLNGKICIDSCPSSLIASLEDRTCSDKCSLVVQGNICQQTCSNGYFSEQNTSSSKLNGDSNNTQKENKITRCQQCSDKCSQCKLTADDCTVCKDEDKLDCFLNEDRKIEYLESKLCSTVDELDKYQCDQTIKQNESLSAISNAVGFTSLFIMILSALSGYSFIGFIGIYYLQIVQQLGNFCLLNIDSLYTVKEIGLKFALSHNIFNLIPMSIFFKQDEKLKELYSQKLFPGLIEIEPITNNMIHNFFYQGCLICGIYLLLIVFYIFLRNTRVYLFTRFNIIIKLWMICSNMLLIGLASSDIFTSESNNQYLQTAWYLVFSNVYIGQIIINIYQIAQQREHDREENSFWQMYSNLNLQLHKRLFWVFFEARKIILVLVVSFTRDSLISIWINISLNGIFLIYIIVLQPIKTKTRNILVLFFELIYTSLIIQLYLQDMQIMPKVFTYSLVAFQSICITISLIYGFKVIIQKIKQYKAKQLKQDSGLLLYSPEFKFEMSNIRTLIPTRGNRQEYFQSVFTRSPDTRYSQRTEQSTSRTSRISKKF